jgi:Retrotransposon gag protein
MQDFQNLQALVQQLQAQLAALPPQPLVAPAPPPRPPSPPEVNKPEEFDGRSERLDQFIHQCILALSLGNWNDQAKITFVLSYMKKGSALTWAEQKLNEYATGNPNAQPAIPPWSIAWADFLNELRTAFGDISRQKTARIRIHDIKQGTRTVDEYNVEFMAEFGLTGFNEEAGLDIWKKGVKRSILQRIFNENPQPITFAEWRTRGSHYDHVDREINAAFPRDHSKSQSRHIGSSSSSKPTTVSTSTPSPSKPTSTSSAPVKVKQERIEESIFAARVARGVCGVCEAPDHRANKCPQRFSNNHRGEPFGRGRGSPHGKKSHKSSRNVNSVEKEETKSQSASGSN